MITTQQAADQLGITRPAVLKAIERGSLKAVKFGREWAITQDAIDHYREVYLGKPGPK